MTTTTLASIIAAPNATFNAKASFIVGMFLGIIGDDRRALDAAYSFVLGGRVTHTTAARIGVTVDDELELRISWASIGAVDAKDAVAYANAITDAAAIGARLVSVMASLARMGFHSDMDAESRTAILATMTGFARAIRHPDAE